MEEGFKVVFAQGNELFSSYEHKGEVKYVVGEVAKPSLGRGPLCVFDNEKYVKRFLHTQINITLSNYHKVYKCKYKRSEHTEVWNGESRVNIQYLPQGTILADEVVLTERV